MNEISGIIPVNKPSGWTSFDVIAKLRGIIRIKRLGHAGTLDPMAIGVLPVFVGKATKACDIMPDDEKAYIAGFAFGCNTDTQDSSGKVLERFEKTATLNDIMSVKGAFEGDIMQIPPMYSAVKIDGKKLYQLAREGKTVERKARPTRVDSIEILSFDEEKQCGEMSVKCSKGTYIRTIIEDIGTALGCGGHMTSLVRILSGGFKLGECYTLEQIQEAVVSDSFVDMVKPLEKVFECYENIKLDAHCTRLYKNGVKLHLEQVGLDEGSAGNTYSVFGFDGKFLGLGKAWEEFSVHKNFY